MIDHLIHFLSFYSFKTNRTLLFLRGSLITNTVRMVLVVLRSCSVGSFSAPGVSNDSTNTHFSVLCLQSQFLLSLQAISIMVHFYMGTKGPENVSSLTDYYIYVQQLSAFIYNIYIQICFFYLLFFLLVEVDKI